MDSARSAVQEEGLPIGRRGCRVSRGSGTVLLYATASRRRSPPGRSPGRALELGKRRGMHLGSAGPRGRPRLWAVEPLATDLQPGRLGIPEPLPRHCRGATPSAIAGPCRAWPSIAGVIGSGRGGGCCDRRPARPARNRRGGPCLDPQCVETLPIEPPTCRSGIGDARGGLVVLLRDRADYPGFLVDFGRPIGYPPAPPSDRAKSYRSTAICGTSYIATALTTRVRSPQIRWVDAGIPGCQASRAAHGPPRGPLAPRRIAKRPSKIE